MTEVKKCGTDERNVLSANDWRECMKGKSMKCKT